MAIIFAESRLDFKYKKFLRELANEYHLLTFSGVLKLAFKPLPKTQQCYFHVRYLKWRGPRLTRLYYTILIAICQVRNIRLVYTCHNLWEHNFQNKQVNLRVRTFLMKHAHDIIVLNESLRDYLIEENAQLANKVKVAHFSDFSEYFDSQDEPNEDFQKKYDAWLSRRGIDRPDLLLVSASYRSLESFKPLFNQSTYHVLCIVPNLIVKDGFGDKVMLYHEGFVKKEVTDLLNMPGMIGLVGLDNGSVATSLYMFASYGIPMLVLDRPPMDRLTTEFEIGELFDLEDDLDQKISQVNNDYQRYRAGCKNLLKAHTWEKSYELHRTVFTG